jgi:N-acetyl-anhydromuramyl-L-alanine amidase AmpD
MRVLNVPAHGATLRDGRIVLLHEPTDYMWHAGALNRTDIGIEVSCRACGIEGNGETLWLPKTYDDLRGDDRLEMAVEASDVQLMATRRLVRYYIELVAENGGQIKYIHAHRQSSKSRVSDPGSRIWREVGEWARNEHGLQVGTRATWTKGGLPLPDVWTGANNGVRYSWRVRGL